MDVVVVSLLLTFKTFSKMSAYQFSVSFSNFVHVFFVSERIDNLLSSNLFISLPYVQT